MPIGTAFHERTLALCESLNFKEWSGYYTVGVYEMTHEHEYNAIRNSSALIDITPLFKYRVTGAAGAIPGAKSSTMAPSHAWAKTIIAGPPPIPACAGSSRMP